MIDIAQQIGAINRRVVTATVQGTASVVAPRSGSIRPRSPTSGRP